MPTVPNPAALDRILSQGIVAILRAEPAEQLPRAIEALVDGGVNVVEVPVTVPGAIEALHASKRRLGNAVCLGAGSILDQATAQAATDVGCEYLVAPVVDLPLIRFGNQQGIPWLAGALSPGEVLGAWQAGCPLVKVFPGDAGGPAWLTAIKAPLPTIRLLPTGGITLENIGDYLSAGASAVGVGSALVSRKLLVEGRFDQITETAQRFVAAHAAVFADA